MHQSLREQRWEQMGLNFIPHSFQFFATEQDLKLEIFLSVGQQCFACTTSTAMRIQPITTLVPIAFNRLNQSAHTRSIAMNLRVVAPDSESDSSALLSSNPTSRSISNHDSIHSSSSNESSFWRFIFWRFDIFVCNQLLRKRFFYCSKQSQKAKEQSICKRQSGDIEETIHYSGDSREDSSQALLLTPAGLYINFWLFDTAQLHSFGLGWFNHFCFSSRGILIVLTFSITVRIISIIFEWNYQRRW